MTAAVEPDLGGQPAHVTEPHQHWPAGVQPGSGGQVRDDIRGPDVMHAQLIAVFAAVWTEPASIEAANDLRQRQDVCFQQMAQCHFGGANFDFRYVLGGWPDPDGGNLSDQKVKGSP